MQVIGFVGTQLLGVHPLSPLSMDCELIIPIMAHCGRALGDIEPC